MKNLSHFRTHARALLACRRCKPCVTQPVRPAGRWLLICCKICSSLATANKLKCQRNSTFSVDFPTENSARMGIDGHNQRFYNMVVNRFTGQAT